MNTNPVSMCLTLRPVARPFVKISVGDTVYNSLQLAETIDVNLFFSAESRACIEIEHFGKSDNDIDTAVIVERIAFFGISDPRFVWSGTYYPNYPEHYENKKPELPGQGYLGWNGVYRLEFDVPVFTWIHRTLNMGWLYN